MNLYALHGADNHIKKFITCQHLLGLKVEEKNDKGRSEQSEVGAFCSQEILPHVSFIVSSISHF